MRLNLEDMDNDPSAVRNNIVSPEEAEAAPQDSEEHLEEALQNDGLRPEGEEDDEDDFFAEDEELGNQEFSALSVQLDQLQSALDEIESRNENIHKELLEILYSNREVRKNLGAENQKIQQPLASTDGEAPGSSSTEEAGGTSVCRSLSPDQVLDSEESARVFNRMQAALLQKSEQMESDSKNLFNLIHSVTESIEKL